MPNQPPAEIFGTDLFGEPIRRAPQAPLAERFLFPPFSVLNAREGEWQERKAAWLSCGIKSELGRGDDLLHYSVAAKNPRVYELKAALEAELGRALELGEAVEILQSRGEQFEESGSSIFDPVLCEVAYRWFCPPGGQVVDPFAGGSVRGIVAGLLGLRYWGCDLRAEQIEANARQRAEICPAAAVEWIAGDSAEQLARAPEADLLFSCPPYGDLERYSDDPRDLSTMKYPAFLAAFRQIIACAAQKLRPNRFAVIVVGEFRDEAGNYRNFIGHTVDAFRRAGLAYYNEAVLITSVGSLPMRTARIFEAARKLGKTHQNVLIFCKGDPKVATARVKEPPAPKPEQAPIAAEEPLLL